MATQESMDTDTFTRADIEIRGIQKGIDYAAKYVLTQAFKDFEAGLDREAITLRNLAGEIKALSPYDLQPSVTPRVTKA